MTANTRAESQITQEKIKDVLRESRKPVPLGQLCYKLTGSPTIGILTTQELVEGLVWMGEVRKKRLSFLSKKYGYCLNKR